MFSTTASSSVPYPSNNQESGQIGSETSSLNESIFLNEKYMAVLRETLERIEKNIKELSERSFYLLLLRLLFLQFVL